MSSGNSRRDREAADARDLFSSGDNAPADPGANVSPLGPSFGGEYDLEGPLDDDESPPPPPIPPAPRRKSIKARDSAADRPEPEPKPEASVDEVWTRWGEWGSTILLLAGVAAAVIFLTYVSSGIGWGTAFLIFFFGLAILVLLSYPIAITLERPVRIAPEQAAKDFYASASHHFPHFRRMWLMLSSEGRQSREFDSFAAFRSYWKHEMTKLRGSNVKASTPLSFRVVDFDSDKSAGKTAVDAKYKLVVTPRGDEGTILLEAPVSTGLVRGPDRMWYLNLGTLPGRR